MNKFKAFVIKYLLPLTEKICIWYLIMKGYQKPVKNHRQLTKESIEKETKR